MLTKKFQLSELDLTEKGFFDGINKAISSGWFRGGIEGAEVTESRVREWGKRVNTSSKDSQEFFR